MPKVNLTEEKLILYCTREEAEVEIRRYRAGRTICVRADVPLYIPEDNLNSYFPGMAFVEVNSNGAIKFVKDVLNKSFEERGGRIKIDVRDNMMFVG